jgi:hypothetical protein
MNGVTNGAVYSPKYNVYDKIKYNGKMYMVFEVDRMNERYGVTEYIPMYINGHSVDQTAMQISGGKGKGKGKYNKDMRKRYSSRKTRRVCKRYYF